MLDKSVEFKNIIMRIKADMIKAAISPTLPEGFSFRLFNKVSDSGDWGRIEASVLEFDSEFEAESYFKKAYIPFADKLRDRCLFVTNQSGLPIATATAWFADSELGHQASLHWVAVFPEYQGMGIGKAIVQKCLCLFRELEPDCDVWLHTQTWSHVAVKMYQRLGFNILKTDRLANANARNGGIKIYENDFLQAMHILQQLLPPNAFNELANTAV